MYTELEKEVILKTIIKNGFYIERAVRAYNKDFDATLTKRTIYQWLKSDQSFLDEYEYYRLDMLDESEEMHRLLRKGIPIYDEDTGEIMAWQEKPDRQAIEFFLKAKGRDRGYVERIEQVKSEVDDINNYSEKELDDEIEALENELGN